MIVAGLEEWALISPGGQKTVCVAAWLDVWGPTGIHEARVARPARLRSTFHHWNLTKLPVTGLGTASVSLTGSICNRRSTAQRSTFQSQPFSGSVCGTRLSIFPDDVCLRTGSGLFRTRYSISSQSPEHGAGSNRPTSSDYEGTISRAPSYFQLNICLRTG